MTETWQWIVRVFAQALCLCIQPTQACNPVCRESPLIGSVIYKAEKRQLELVGAFRLCCLIPLFCAGSSCQVQW